MASQSAHAVAIFKLPINRRSIFVNQLNTGIQRQQKINTRGTPGEKEKSKLKLLCM